MQIYHNPRCSKSREAFDILQESGEKVDVVEYLKTPPSVSELKAILKKLGMRAEEIVRKGEDVFKEKFKDRKLTEEQWIQALADNPVLIERPIIIKGSRAVIGRPPEKVRELL